MVSDTSAVGSTKSAATNSAQADLSNFASSTSSQQVSKDQFLQLLVTQLKNQDPMNPMDSQQFAVNLAQFSQLEQLVSINNKIGNSSTDSSSLAGYLGQEVSLNKQTVSVGGGNGGLLQVNVPNDVDSLSVQLTDAQGRVQDTQQFNNVKKGQQTLSLGSVKAPDGEYSFTVTATSGSQTSQLAANPAGIVSGFVPGANPQLVVNGSEVALSDIKQVSIAPSAPTAGG